MKRTISEMGRTISETRRTISFAFKQTIPVLFGYLFIGIAFGLLLQKAGYHFLWAPLCSVVIYAGSMQYMLVTLLSGGASIITCIAMTLFINGRHVFYGLSFVEKFKNMGKFYPYMIFSLTDETYSVLCALKTPEDVNEKKAMFFIALFDQSYWIIGSTIGAIMGHLIPFNSEGVDFAMTALFVVIFINYWQESTNHFPALLGIASAVILLVILNPDNFILPSLLTSTIILLLCRGQIEKAQVES